MTTADPSPDTGTRYAVTRMIAAPPEAVFALLADPEIGRASCRERV